MRPLVWREGISLKCVPDCAQSVLKERPTDVEAFATQFFTKSDSNREEYHVATSPGGQR